MIRRILTVLTVLVAGVAALSAAPRIGSAAPGFVGLDSNGNRVSLSDFDGRVVVLEWTNHDCPYVGKHYGTDNMQRLQRDATGAGVVWLSIISSAPGRQGHVSADRANGLTAERSAAPTAVVLDESGDIGRLYEARTTPHMFVIDQTGALVYAGGIDDQPSAQWASVDGARNYVREALDDVLAGRTVRQSSSRPYGCTVKY